jgi:hypothetical protein
VFSVNVFVGAIFSHPMVKIQWNLPKHENTGKTASLPVAPCNHQRLTMATRLQPNFIGRE